MKLENVQVELERLLALVQGWDSRAEIPSIERDLALDKLKTLYEEFRFLRPGTDEPRAAAEAGPEVPALEVIDLDEVLLSEEPLVPAEPELPQSAAAEPADPEPVSESESAEPVSEPAAKPVERSDPEPEKEEAPRLQNSLFDLGEIPVHRRESRRVLMSLYGDTPARKANKLRTKPQPEPRPEKSPDETIVEIPLAAVPMPESEPVPVPIAEEVPVREEMAVAEPAAELPEEVAPAADPAPAVEEAEEFGEAVFSEEPVETVPARPEPVAESVPVLGEVIGADRRTLADAIAPQRGDLGTVAAGAIDSLRSAIGINDRFLLIGELFGGNADLYERTIDALEGMETLDDCLIYAAENYTWNPNSDGVKRLFELLERKYGAC